MCKKAKKKTWTVISSFDSLDEAKNYVINMQPLDYSLDTAMHSAGEASVEDEAAWYHDHGFCVLQRKFFSRDVVVRKVLCKFSCCASLSVEHGM